jgi:aspartate aminotransferase-like enzyme
MEPNTEKLPDPWLFDSEALLRELDRCRETVLQIPITNPNATHFGIQLAVNAIFTLSENLRYLLHLHREQQRAIRKQHEQSLEKALSKPTAAHRTIVHLHTPAATRRKKPHAERPNSQRPNFAKGQHTHARGVSSSQVA